MPRAATITTPDLQAWARLARDLERRRELASICPIGSACRSCAESIECARQALIAYCTPERILGLIDAAQQQQQQDREDKTAKNQPQEPEPKVESLMRAQPPVETIVRHPNGHLIVERMPAYLPTEAEERAVLASLSKAWPVLAKHAHHIDGEFDGALSRVRRMFTAYRAELAAAYAMAGAPVPASDPSRSIP